MTERGSGILKQICQGTLITLVYQSRAKRGARPKAICEGIFAAYGLEINS